MATGLSGLRLGLRGESGMEVQPVPLCGGDLLWVTLLLHQPWLGRKEAGGGGGQSFTVGEAGILLEIIQMRL